MTENLRARVHVLGELDDVLNVLLFRGKEPCKLRARGIRLADIVKMQNEMLSRMTFESWRGFLVGVVDGDGDGGQRHGRPFYPFFACRTL